MQETLDGFFFLNHSGLCPTYQWYKNLTIIIFGSRAFPLPTIHKSPRAYEVEILVLLLLYLAALEPALCNIWTLESLVDWGASKANLESAATSPLKVSIQSNHGNLSHPSPHFPISEQVDQSLKFPNQISPLPNYRKDRWSRHHQTLPLCLGPFIVLWWTSLCLRNFSFQSQEKASSYIAVWKFQGINTTLPLEQAAIRWRWCVNTPALSPFCSRWEEKGCRGETESGVHTSL